MEGLGLEDKFLRIIILKNLTVLWGFYSFLDKYDIFKIYHSSN